MYYQTFFKREISSPESQISCDNKQELTEELERLNRPKFVRVEFYDCTGYVGTKWMLYSALKENYTIYKVVGC